jgi:hypothetical protein
LKIVGRAVIIYKQEPQMSDENIYTHELERLITQKFLPVYELYCKEHNIDIYSSGIPIRLLAKLKQKQKLPALFLPKQNSEC